MWTPSLLSVLCWPHCSDVEAVVRGGAKGFGGVGVCGVGWGATRIPPQGKPSSSRLSATRCKQQIKRLLPQKAGEGGTEVRKKKNDGQRTKEKKRDSSLGGTQKMNREFHI